MRSTRAVFYPPLFSRVIRIRHACRTLPTHQWDHHIREREPGGHASEARAAEEEEEEEEQDDDDDDDEKRRGGGGDVAEEVESKGGCAAICSPES